MAIQNHFDKEFILRFFEMNESGKATPTTILTLLEEAAAEHCLSIGEGLYKLAGQGIGWVLVSGIMKIDRYPFYKERIKVRTWLSNYSSVRGIRENLILDQKGGIIGRAKGLWVFFDIHARRPKEIFQNIKSKWSFWPEESISHNISQKIPSINDPDHVLEFKVNRFDTDMVRHLNNIKYLQWALESIPESIIRRFNLYSIDGRFLHEAQLGDVLVSYTQKCPNSSNAYLHLVKNKETDKVCATARSEWIDC